MANIADEVGEQNGIYQIVRKIQILRKLELFCCFHFLILLKL